MPWCDDRFQVGGKDSIIYAGELSKVYAIQNAAFEKYMDFMQVLN